MIKIAYICVHNSCRSQMAEALTKHLYNDLLVYSAGTELVPQINQDALRIIKSEYNIDMSNQKPKLIEDIPSVDIVITMGCNVNCPNIKCSHQEDWGLDDPSHKEDAEFIKTAELIYNKIIDLKSRIDKKIIKIGE